MKYTSKNFHLHYIAQYKLLVKTDFLVDTLLVVDDNGEVIVLYSYAANEPDAEAMKLLGLPFKHVFIGLPVQSLSFIPTDVYTEEDSALYQDFLLDEYSERTHYYSIPNLGVTAIYQYDLLLYNRWRAIFPNAHFLADFQLVLGEAQSRIPLQGEILGAHFKDTQVELFVFKNGVFQFYNIFDIETLDDLYYFLLNTCQSLDLQAPVQKILVSGIHNEHSYLQALGRFAEHIEFIKIKSAFHANDESVATKLNELNLMTDYSLCV